MLIRQAKPKDIPRISELLVQVCHVHAQGRPDIFKDGQMKYTADELLDIMEDENKVILVASDENDTVLGYMFGIYQCHPNDNILTDIKTLYIDDLCVDNKLHRNGIGKALYNATLDLAKQTGCYNVTLNVWQLNPDALAFYKAMNMDILKIMMETKIK